MTASERDIYVCRKCFKRITKCMPHVDGLDLMFNFRRGDTINNQIRLFKIEERNKIKKFRVPLTEKDVKYQEELTRKKSKEFMQNNLRRVGNKGFEIALHYLHAGEEREIETFKKG